MSEWDTTPEGKEYHRKKLNEWREKNKDHANEYHKEYMKAWRERNRDRINQKQKEYQIANHEKVKEYRRRYMEKWRAEHREEQKAYRHEYYMANCDEPRNPKRVKYPDPVDTHSITKEEWLKRYGYPMGDTTGWEHWLGWDTRIRRYDD